MEFYVENPTYAQPAGPYKPRTSRTGQCMNHALAILAAPAVYCIHGRIIHQARSRQTVQNVNEKHAATHHPHWLPQQTRIGRQTAQTSNTV